MIGIVGLQARQSNRPRSSSAGGARGKNTNLRLDGWYSIQKKNIEQLTVDRQAKLRALPGYVPFTQPSQAWPKKLEETKQFVKQHRRLPKFRSEDQYEASLALWLSRQKAAFDSLSTEKREALQELPEFQIMISSTDLWQEKFASLQSFVNSNSGRLPTRKTDLQLANWLYRQTAKFHNLPIDQQEKLASIREFRRLVSDKSQSKSE